MRKQAIWNAVHEVGIHTRAVEDLIESAKFHNVRHSQPGCLRAAAPSSAVQHLNESAWFSIPKGTKQYGVDNAENCRRGPDAEREREHGHGGEAGVLQQLAEGEFEVVHGSWSVVG